MSDDLATPAPEADATKAVADADPKAKEEANTLKAEKSEPETVSEDADKPDTEDKDDQPRDKQGRFEKRKERLSSEIASRRRPSARPSVNWPNCLAERKPCAVT